VPVGYSQLRIQTFPKWCSWRFHYSGIWRYANG